MGGGGGDGSGFAVVVLLLIYILFLCDYCQGHFKDGTYDAIPMNETKWYTEDLFGLKTVDQRGDIHFETTAGNHLQFTETQLFGWVDKYF